MLMLLELPRPRILDPRADVSMEEYLNPLDDACFLGLACFSDSLLSCGRSDDCAPIPPYRLV